MKKLVVLIAALAALAFAVTASADPPQTPHGYVGSCNGMTSNNAGMNNAVNQLLSSPGNGISGINGMITSIANTAGLGAPNYCG